MRLDGAGVGVWLKHPLAGVVPDRRAEGRVRVVQFERGDAGGGPGAAILDLARHFRRSHRQTAAAGGAVHRDPRGRAGLVRRRCRAPAAEQCCAREAKCPDAYASEHGAPGRSAGECGNHGNLLRGCAGAPIASGWSPLALYITSVVYTNVLNVRTYDTNEAPRWAPRRDAGKSHRRWPQCTIFTSPRSTTGLPARCWSTGSRSPRPCRTRRRCRRRCDGLAAR